jgi:ATP-dependent DNA helicase RecG
MAKKREDKIFDPRPYMQLAIAEMNKSKNEPRPDGKVPPKVGAILVFPNGKVIQAHRGELREGDHAEFSLLERKLGHEKLDDCILFTTLEPCVERNPPKVPCCRRTTNARIKTVYVGIIDPDPTVSTKGIEHLKKHFVNVKMFDRDLQKQIETENKDFLKQALERKRKAKEEDFLTPIELPVANASFEKLSAEALQKFINSAKLPYKIEQPEFKDYLIDMGVMTLDKNSNTYKPNGYGILLFGMEPRNVFKGAALKCTAKLGKYEFKPESFDQSLVLVPDLAQEWLKKVLAQEKDTSSFKRTEKEGFPLEVLREAVINAIVHRDYSIEGSKNAINIDDDSIVIKSPGAPPSTITLDQLNTFKAPSYSRNPLISLVFNKMGYVEETGLGMASLKSLNEKYGLPLPEYDYNNLLLTLTFPKTMEAVKKVSHHPNIAKLNDAQLKGYEWLKSVDEASTREYSVHFDIGYKTAQRHLATMKELGLIRDNGEGTNSPNYKYAVNK